MATFALSQEDISSIALEVFNRLVKHLDSHSRDPANVRVAFTEEEAAKMIGMNAHQLRDERHRGKISAAQIVQGRIRYTMDDIRKYLASRPYRAGSR